MKTNPDAMSTGKISPRADGSHPHPARAFALCSASLFLAILCFSLAAPNASAQTVGGMGVSFTGVGSMNSPRYRQTATLLGNGKVLMAGGFVGGYSMTNTAELFDPATGTFTPLPSTMTSTRDGATATLLPNGKVLIAGGFNYDTSDGYLNTADLFDPATGTFTALPPMTSARVFHTATLLPNGKVLIAGGFSTLDIGIANTAELFDPGTGTFSRTSPMTWGRGYHTATLLPSGKVLIAGGYGPAALNGGTNTAELFDPISGTFALISSMTFTRYGHTATLLASGQVLIAGGYDQNSLNEDGPDATTNTAELFDPASGSFTVVQDLMTSPRDGHTATLLPSGKVLLAGGEAVNVVGNPTQVSNTAELFDPDQVNPVTGAKGAFTSLLPNTMISAREGHTATLLPIGKVLLAGGSSAEAVFLTYIGTLVSNTAELFDSPADRAGFSEARRPVILTAPDTLVQPASLVLTGTGFRGDSEGSGGSFGNSATNYPILQLTRIEDGQSFFVPSDPETNWSDTSFTSATLSNLSPGQYRVTVFTNAIPSLSKIVNITLPVPLVSVVSRKVHGSVGPFDIDLTSGSGVECRSGGATGDYTIVFTFANTLSSVGSANVTGGTGSVVSGNIDSSDARNYIVSLTGVTNAQVITLSLANVTDSIGNFSPAVAGQMGVLLGDVNASRRVDAADVSSVRQQTLQALSNSNFRNDLNASGRIDAADVSIARQQTLTSLPSPP